MMKVFWPLLVVLLLLAPASTAQKYQYVRTGANEAAHSKYQFGLALMGGGSDLDDAFRWLCGKSGGGDFLILRAAGSDDYNPYVKGLCRVNSVSTLIIPDRDSTQDPRVAEIIRSAQAIFIAGGDQARYVNSWKGTPVQDAINADIAEGKPIGGTSAGLAVLGEFIYGALQDKEDDKDLTSPEVLRNPYFNRVTLARGFLQVPLLRNLLTDSHFAKRHRLGRSLVFLARIIQDGWSEHPREIAIDEKSAVLVEADGSAKVVGSGKGAYFIEATEKPELCVPGKLLTIHGITSYHAPKGASFDLKRWTGKGGESYVISVVEGKIVSQVASQLSRTD